MLLSIRRFRRARAVVAVLLLTSLEACYTYLPVTSASPTVGQRVRVTLTPEGITEMSRYLGPSVAVAEGQLTSVTANDSYVLAVTFVQQTNGQRQPWSGEGFVTIPAQYRESVSERTFQRRQSWVAGTVLGAALVAVALIALNAVGAGQGDCPGCGPPPPP